MKQEQIQKQKHRREVEEIELLPEAVDVSDILRLADIAIANIEEVLA